ncbi:MAG TPA: efflux RND transporter permease subunit [Bryobacteraceae bacterium]|nr:efflux RND transporter permease subunit [Bryobacteraceae bacterium]
MPASRRTPQNSGSSGLLFLSRKAFSSSTPYRFIPAHRQLEFQVVLQVGLVVLMGLACKNAILIVEFARELEIQGKGIVEAALEACRMRLRPIVMTSLAFIAGSVPLLLGHGAGSEVRAATGITVFSGMLGVTLFGLFLTPVFYVALRTWIKTEVREEWNEPREEREESHA